MNTHTDPDLVKVTEIFLVPSSFLVAALGTADTNLHRAGVSALGLIISALWCVCSWEALKEHRIDPAKASHPLRTRILSALPIIFIAGWLLSVVIHLLLWNVALGHN